MRRDINAHVMAVVAQMGLEGVTQLPDGSIRLPDGRIVGNVGLDGEESDGDGNEVSRGGGAGKWDGGAHASAIFKGVPPSVQAMVKDLEAEVRRVKEKLQVRSAHVQSGGIFVTVRKRRASPGFELLEGRR